MGHISERVDWWLAEGWRPARSLEHTWVRGAVDRQVGEDTVEDLEGAETAVMTKAEEAELITRNYAAQADG